MSGLRDRPPFAPGPEPPTTPGELRTSIPACGSVAYFNTGATGPTPEPILDTVDRWHRRHKTDVLIESDPYAVGFDAYDACRERVAPFLGADPAEVALAESTGDALSAVIAALELESGDRVVTTDLEHPAADLPLGYLRDRRGIEIERVATDAGRIDTDRFAAAVADAEVACFSSLSWNYGTLLPVEELVGIARDAGAFTLVDAVQEPGHRPLDVTAWGADAVAASGHKWLLGVWGSGILYVDGDAADRLHPAQLSYRGAAAADDPRPAAGARRFERGTASIAPHVGLAESVRFADSVGMETVSAEVRRLADRLVSGLDADRVLSPTDAETGLVTVDVPEPEATVERLRDAGVAIRSLPDPDAVRASVHAFNTDREVDRLAELLADEY
ncbi:MAG: aminotransferase class V-fold PLP-dependent enzyme [Halobaculum sp.]